MNRRKFAAVQSSQTIQKHAQLIDELIRSLRAIDESAAVEIHARASDLLTQGKRLQALPLFKSVDQALTKIHEARATSGVRTAIYGIQTVASSAPEKVTTLDRVAEAAWVFEVVDATLTEVERAVVTCKYEGFGRDRAKALDALTEANLDLARCPDLVRALLIREFDFGETYAKSLPVIATATGCALRTVERAAQKTRQRVADLYEDIDDALRAAFEPRGWLAKKGVAYRRFDA